MRLSRSVLVLCFLLLGGAAATAALMYAPQRLTHPTNVSAQADGIEEPAGDRHNSYAWAMDTMTVGGKEYIYVGCNRDVLRLVMLSYGFTDYDIESFFSGDVPVGSIDLRARIYRYPLDGSGPWERVYTSPTFAVGVPLDVGYRGMQNFGGNLYVVTAGNLGGYTRVLRFPNTGAAPEEVFRAAHQASLRPITVYQGALYVGSGDNTIYASDDPQVQPPVNILHPGSSVGWTQVATDADLGNSASDGVGIWEMAEFNGYLYVSLGQPFQTGGVTDQGFRLYRGRDVGVGEPGANAAGWVWEPIIDSGAAYPRGLGNPNNSAASLHSFQGHLYIGTLMDVIDQTGQGTVFSNYTPCQLYRLDQSDHIDMVIGDPDTLFPTRIGNYRAGFFDDTVAQGQLPAPQNQANYSVQPYLWWMDDYDGRLYVSTFDMGVFFRYVTAQNLATLGVSPADQQTILDGLDVIKQVNTDPAGFDLYSSSDGVNFEPVTLDGFGDPFNYGGRTLKSTTAGLIVGTANPFYGCQVWRVNTEVGTTGDSSVRSLPFSGGGGGVNCFVATAAFGSPLASQVDMLRGFRDRYLLTNSPGQAFVKWYYQEGPKGAVFMNEHPSVKPLARMLLYPLVGVAWLAMRGFLPGVTLALLAGLLLVLRRRRRRRLAVC